MTLISSNLKIIRKHQGLSQYEVAIKANMTLANYSKIECGLSEPRLKTALLIAKALGESIDRIFTLKEDRR